MRGLLSRLFSALLAVGAIAAVVLLMIGIFGHIPQSTTALSAGEPTPGRTAAGPTTAVTTALPSIPTTAVSTPPATSPGGAQGPPAIPEIEVVVLNSTGVSGLASRVSDYLGGLGWRVQEPSNFLTRLDSTTVYYPEGQEEAARQLAAVAPGSADTIALVIPEVAADVLTVVVGADAAEWSPPSGPDET